MALYVTRPRRDEVRIGRGLPSVTIYILAHAFGLINTVSLQEVDSKVDYIYRQKL